MGKMSDWAGELKENVSELTEIRDIHLSVASAKSVEDSVRSTTALMRKSANSVANSLSGIERTAFDLGREVQHQWRRMREVELVPWRRTENRWPVRAFKKEGPRGGWEKKPMSAGYSNEPQFMENTRALVAELKAGKLKPTYKKYFTDKAWKAIKFKFRQLKSHPDYLATPKDKKSDVVDRFFQGIFIR